MKAIELWFTVVPFILLYKVALTFESVDEIPLAKVCPFKCTFKCLFNMLYKGSNF